MFQFHSKYAIIAVLLFLSEVCIAVFIHDNFIRPNIGDFLVVILIYCFIKSFLNIGVNKAAISVLIFSYLIEILQYFNYGKLLGLNQYKLARIVLGTSFSWKDIVAYTLGIAVVIGIEKARILMATKNLN